MYDRESLLNQMFVDYINTLAAAVTQENLHTRPVESGHTPLWILGHVAICAELGIKMLGGEIEHRAWLPLFAPGSKDNFTSSDGHSRDELLSCIQSSYAKLCEMAKSADDEVLDRPHGVELLNDTVLNTVGDVVAHLMTTHMAFHAAQLSAWRQASGHKYMF